MFKTQAQYTNNRTINCPIFHPFEIICITDIISKENDTMDAQIASSGTKCRICENVTFISLILTG